MNQNLGATHPDAYSQSWLTRSLQPLRKNPRIFGRVLGICLVLVGGAAIELPGSPVFAQVVCRSIKRGDTGPTVRAVQQTLADNNYPVGGVDGVFGEMTQISLISFQRKNNLDPDGEVGSATCDALIKVSNSKLVKAAPAPAPPVNGSASSNTTLKRDDSGPDVTALQNSLRARGFNDLVVTGIFDEKTENTVKRLQLIEGLPVTGQADPATKKRLNDFLASNPPTPTPSPVPTPPTPTPVPTPLPPVVFEPVPTPPAPPVVATTNNSNKKGYRVVVPARNIELLARVKVVVPNAVLGRTRLGNFVDAGTYTNRFDAESLSNKLKARGLDARVVRP
ncbi:MAG: peptidoglycan-binding protein [Limnothrix sp.]